VAFDALVGQESDGEKLQLGLFAFHLVLADFGGVSADVDVDVRNLHLPISSLWGVRQEK
jgi:hypothetical protein